MPAPLPQKQRRCWSNPADYPQPRRVECRPLPFSIPVSCSFSFSFSSRWHRSVRKGPYALRPVSQQSPQGCNRNSANICLVEHRSFSNFEGGMSATSFLHSSFLQAINAVMLWPVHVQKVPQASEHLCPAKLQTRCDICRACQSIYPFIPTDSGVQVINTVTLSLTLSSQGKFLKLPITSALPSYRWLVICDLAGRLSTYQQPFHRYLATTNNNFLFTVGSCKHSGQILPDCSLSLSLSASDSVCRSASVCVCVCVWPNMHTCVYHK